MFTAWASRRAPASLVAALRLDSGPPLFYLAERPFAQAADRPARDPLVRILPFAAGLALFAAARTLPRGPARRWWIALCASFALVNLYAAEARGYALLSLFCLGIFLLALTARQSAARLASLFALAAAALWLHYLALFAVGAALLLALGLRRPRCALALAAALAAFAPWAPVLLAQPGEAMAWLRDAPTAALPGFLSALGGVGRVPAPFGPAPPHALFVAGALLGAALIALLLPAARADAAIRAALLYVAIVLGLTVAASLWRPTAFAGRSEMAVLPVWMWAIARAAADRRGVAKAAALASALGLAATIFVVGGSHPRSTPSAAVASVGRLSTPADAVLAGPGFYLPALLAADRGRLPAKIAALPAGDEAHPGWFVAGTPGQAEEAAVARAMDAAPSSARLFVILPPSHDTPGIMRVLSSRGTVRELVRQPDGVLLVWSPARASGGDAAKAPPAS